ncbi:MAG: isoprenylcysteine carboxylmethyltransferase family protein [Desulfobacteraceae bacterium]|nr:isoprenylcysteine carboxylmethyltransferase family protein [Desulfobacteraceae bacterium]
MKGNGQLLKIWNRFNGLIFFHPQRWPHGEILSRTTALLVVGAFLVNRFIQFDQFPQTFAATSAFYGAFRTVTGDPVYSNAAIAVVWGIKALVWGLEIAVYFGYILAYIGRAKAVSVARGFMETAYPVIIAGLPVLIFMAPYTLPTYVPVSSPRHVYFYVLISLLIAVGGAVNLIGLLSLRKGFTIMTEARVLITTGIFRYIRHPLYSGHFIIFLGSLLLRLHIYTVILYIAFLLGQLHRSRIEERKLRAIFPEHDRYRQFTGMFFPRFSGYKIKKMPEK